jgi:hypothetical protein
MADMLDDFLQRLRTLAPDLPAQTTLQLEVQTRQAWGGTDRNYIAKRPALQRTVKIGESLRAHKPLAQVFEDAGVRKTFGYDLLRRR